MRTPIDSNSPLRRARPEGPWANGLSSGITASIATTSRSTGPTQQAKARLEGHPWIIWKVDETIDRVLGPDSSRRGKDHIAVMCLPVKRELTLLRHRGLPDDQSVRDNHVLPLCQRQHPPRG